MNARIEAGNWSKEKDVTPPAIYDRDGLELCRMSSDISERDMHTIGQAISAIPEMVSALKTALCELQRLAEQEHNYHVCRYTIGRVEAAIGKAGANI